jgi:hypothetical protein
MRLKGVILSPLESQYQRGLRIGCSLNGGTPILGTVDRVEGNRIKLTRADSGEDSHRATIIAPREAWSRAEVEGSKVRLSAKGDVAVTMEAEK